MSDKVLPFPAADTVIAAFGERTSNMETSSNVIKFSSRSRRQVDVSDKQIITDIIALAKRADEAGMQSVAAVLIGAMFMVVDGAPDPDDDGGGASLQPSGIYRER